MMRVERQGSRRKGSLAFTGGKEVSETVDPC
jgi:hypothetical protein